MYKMWKIGTDISSYVKQMELWLEEEIDWIKIGNILNSNNVVFQLSNGDEVEYNDSKAMQLIRILIALGLLKTNRNFKYEKDLIEDKTYYNFAIIEKNKNIYETITNHLLSRIKHVFEDDNLIFPSEGNFLFSILCISLFKSDESLEKRINSRSLSGKVKDIIKYYGNINDSLIETENFDQLISRSFNYIVGFGLNAAQVMKSINGKLSNKIEDVIKYEKGIENELISSSYTFGTFLNDFFSKKNLINIPIYQRKYVWPEKTVKNLLYDIIECKRTHYIGNITLQEKSFRGKNISKIIDGQQRITTLILIARALFDFCKYKSYFVDRDINKLLDSNNYISLSKTFKRVKGNKDYEAFQNIILGEVLKINSKNSRIESNYYYILDWISKTIFSEKKCKKFWDSLLNKIVFATINVKSANEYGLFERLNTGATPLNTVELFKNYIFNVANNYSENIDEEHAQHIFEKHVYSKFFSKNKDKEINNFIVTSLRLHNSIFDSSESDFAQYKNLVETKYILNAEFGEFNLDKILGHIGNEIDAYNEIRDYAKYSLKNISWAYPFADFLYILDGRSVYYPLILKIIFIKSKDYKNLKFDEIISIRKFLRVIEIYEVRMQIATYRGQSLSTKIEKIINKFNINTSPESLWYYFSEGQKSTGMADLDFFRESIKSNGISNKPAKLLMTRIENYVYLNGWDISNKDYTFRAMYENKSQREHLLPVKWKKNWKEYLEKQTGRMGEELEFLVKKYIDFIGNTFPIPAWSNNEVNNLSIHEKIKRFKKEAYFNDVDTFHGFEIHGIKIESIDENNFSIKTIQERSKKIAELASIIWKKPDFK